MIQIRNVSLGSIALHLRTSVLQEKDTAVQLQTALEDILVTKHAILKPINASLQLEGAQAILIVRIGNTATPQIKYAR